MAVPLDSERCYRAVESRDHRFDGWFIVAVTTTGIYCRPSCPAPIRPRRDRCRFFPTTAAAQLAGFRACKRCRPDASPGSPEWNVRTDLVGRAMRLVADGVVDREGVVGLARRLAVSPRHLHRVLSAEVGAPPVALARAQRAQAARVLIETTELPFSDVAFAAGFSSIRQFNDTVRQVFALPPRELRRGGAHRDGPRAAGLVLRLPYRPPLDERGLWRFLAARSVPGVEVGGEDGYSRTLRLPHGPATVTLRSATDHVSATLRLTDLADLSTAVWRCRRLLDLDADPLAVADALGADPRLVPVLARHPGRRSPGAVDADELAVRAVLGQQISVVGARTLAGRLVAAHGEALSTSEGGLTHLFPGAAALAEADPGDWPLPGGRKRALQGLCRALAEGTVDLGPGVDRAEARRRLLELPGIGDWTASYVAMRALGDPDAFLCGDTGVRAGARRLGIPPQGRELVAHAERWRPWRAYATHHLWAAAHPDAHLEDVRP